MIKSDCKVVFRSNYSSSKGFSKPVDFSGPNGVSRTKQGFRKEADIDFIVAQGMKRGFLVDPVVAASATRKPFYGDFTAIPDFVAVQTRLNAVQTSFDALPASVREFFSNDPSQVIDFLSDASNDAKAVELGLKTAVVPAPAPSPAPTPVAGGSSVPKPV